MLRPDRDVSWRIRSAANVRLGWDGRTRSLLLKKHQSVPEDAGLSLLRSRLAIGLPLRARSTLRQEHVIPCRHRAEQRRCARVWTGDLRLVWCRTPAAVAPVPQRLHVAKPR